MPFPWPQVFVSICIRVLWFKEMATAIKLKFRSVRHPVRASNDSGTSAVEFAMVLPLFLFLFLGIIEYGWFMTKQALLDHAVSQGARSAVQMPADTSEPELIRAARMKTREVFSLVGTINDSDIIVDILDAETIGGEDRMLPRRIVVSVEALIYPPLTGYLPDSLLPGSLQGSFTGLFP